ncbi:hypothetical protein OBJ94_11030 [Empedobacter falsenii]
MKKLKMIILVAGALFFTVNAAAQGSETSFFSSTKAAGPGVGGGDSDVEDPIDTTPIDDYLPLLVIGAGLIALRFRKQLLKK